MVISLLCNKYLCSYNIHFSLICLRCVSFLPFALARTLLQLQHLSFLPTNLQQRRRIRNYVILCKNICDVQCFFFFVSHSLMTIFFVIKMHFSVSLSLFFSLSLSLFAVILLKSSLSSSFLLSTKNYIFISFNLWLWLRTIFLFVSYFNATNIKFFITCVQHFY